MNYSFSLYLQLGSDEYKFISDNVEASYPGSFILWAQTAARHGASLFHNDYKTKLVNDNTNYISKRLFFCGSQTEIRQAAGRGLKSKTILSETVKIPSNLESNEIQYILVCDFIAATEKVQEYGYNTKIGSCIPISIAAFCPPKEQ